MRISLSGLTWHKSRFRLLGFTVPEMMLASTISAMIIGAVVYSNLLGLKLQELSKSKLNATQDARKLLNNAFSDIRSAQRIDIGNTTCSTADGSGAVFTMISDGSSQAGNSIKIYPEINTNGVNTNYYIHYFYHAYGTDQCLRRCVANNSTYTISKIAHAVSNQNIFTCEDILGNTVTNRRFLPKPLGIYLQFFEIVYPRATIATNGLYESYQYRTRVTCRTFNVAGN